EGELWNEGRDFLKRTQGELKELQRRQADLVAKGDTASHKVAKRIDELIDSTALKLMRLKAGASYDDELKSIQSDLDHRFLQVCRICDADVLKSLSLKDDPKKASLDAAKRLFRKGKEVFQNLKAAARRAISGDGR